MGSSIHALYDGIISFLPVILACVVCVMFFYITNIKTRISLLTIHLTMGMYWLMKFVVEETWHANFFGLFVVVLLVIAHIEMTTIMKQTKKEDLWEKKDKFMVISFYLITFGIYKKMFIFAGVASCIVFGTILISRLNRKKEKK